jgi:hypothetical protein
LWTIRFYQKDVCAEDEDSSGNKQLQKAAPVDGKKNNRSV